MMNKLLFYFLGCGVFTAFGQDYKPHRCLTPEYISHLDAQQSGTAASIQSAYEDNVSRIRSANYQKSDDEYIIPVVFHVVYNNAAQNLHDSIIMNQLLILNEDYNRLNGDSANLRNQFLPYKGKVGVRFVLASYDPDGNPTTGIVRRQTNVSSFFTAAALQGDFSSLERVKSDANGGSSPWNTNKYLNIWVCNMAMTYMNMTIPAILGYAKPPLNMSNWPAGSVPNITDGVVLQYQTVGRNNPHSPMNIMGTTVEFFGRTATHEVGHYLGLRHIWGDGDCNVDDGLSDTPNMIESSDQDCDVTKNTCVDNIDGVDLPDLIENFMDYSAEDCQNMFTAQQANLMRSVMENQRYDLTHNNVNSVQKVDAIQAQLYPNPAQSEITIQTSQVLNGTLTIVDVTGRTVKVISTHGDVTKVAVNDMVPGVYSVSFEGKQIARFVKQ